MGGLSDAEIKHFNAYFGKTTAHCLASYETAAATDVTALATAIMALPGYPMHYPTHHYLVPAVLLTATRKKQGHGADVLKRDLDEALERAMEVPGGFCGFQGTCGAAVGVGIFWSIVTDATPLSVESWAWSNRATGTALLQMAAYGGPRCCKRTSYLALLSTLPQITTLLKIAVTASQPTCQFYGQNEDGCLKDRCPFHPKEG